MPGCDPHTQCPAPRGTCSRVGVCRSRAKPPSHVQAVLGSTGHTVSVPVQRPCHEQCSPVPAQSMAKHRAWSEGSGAQGERTGRPQRRITPAGHQHRPPARGLQLGRGKGPEPTKRPGPGGVKASSREQRGDPGAAPREPQGLGGLPEAGRSPALRSLLLSQPPLPGSSPMMTLQGIPFPGHAQVQV